jgi:hypothetical protein
MHTQLRVAINALSGTMLKFSRKDPEPIPLVLEERPKTTLSSKKIERDRNTDKERVEFLVAKAEFVLDAGYRTRDARVEQSLKVQRGRAERIRQYQLCKETPPVPDYIKAAEAHKGERPLKSLDEWLGNAGPKVRSGTRVT